MRIMVRNGPATTTLPTFEWHPRCYRMPERRSGVEGRITDQKPAECSLAASEWASDGPDRGYHSLESRRPKVSRCVSARVILH